MKEFFNTIYYYTNSMYDQNLDNYLYQTVPGYLHIGLAMVIVTFIASVLFYYLFKPIQKQIPRWFLAFGCAAIINFFIAIWYTATPLINNEVDSNVAWSGLDCFSLGIVNIAWTFAFFVVAALIFKWWSPCKYVPFCKF